MLVENPTLRAHSLFPIMDRVFPAIPWLPRGRKFIELANFSWFGVL